MAEKSRQVSQEDIDALLGTEAADPLETAMLAAAAEGESDELKALRAEADLLRTEAQDAKAEVRVLEQYIEEDWRPAVAERDQQIQESMAREKKATELLEATQDELTQAREQVETLEHDHQRLITEAAEDEAEAERLSKEVKQAEETATGLYEELEATESAAKKFHRIAYGLVCTVGLIGLMAVLFWPSTDWEERYYKKTEDYSALWKQYSALTETQPGQPQVERTEEIEIAPMPQIPLFEEEESTVIVEEEPEEIPVRPAPAPATPASGTLSDAIE